jgi:hypothetical protein
VRGLGALVYQPHLGAGVPLRSCGESRVSCVGRVKSRASSKASAAYPRPGRASLRGCWSPSAHSGLLNPSPDFLSLSGNPSVYLRRRYNASRPVRCGASSHPLVTTGGAAHAAPYPLRRPRATCWACEDPDPKTPRAASVDCDAAARRSRLTCWANRAGDRPVFIPFTGA